MSISSAESAGDVCVWDLATSDHNPEDEILNIGPQADSQLDTILDYDQRILVDQTDYRRGGRYYCKYARQIVVMRRC
jgi:hypothetical protein